MVSASGTAANNRKIGSNAVHRTVAVKIMLRLGCQNYRLPCSEDVFLAPLLPGGMRIPMPPPRDLDFISCTAFPAMHTCRRWCCILDIRVGRPAFPAPAPAASKKADQESNERTL
ncbi:hypothetical protein KC359_g88 [Hortaea werneckii]|nr:hypothetical protein KC359_g88 [Hortaea werneckii]